MKKIEPLKPGNRHNPYKEAEKLVDYLKRNPYFKGAAICMSHGKGVVTILTVGDLKGAKASFCVAIKRHGNQLLETNTE
jgi:hypothetical protein